VTRGRVTITVPNLPGQVVNRQLSIDAPGASARFFSPGVYQLLVTGDDEPEVQLGVTHGSAQLTSDAGQVMLADAESSEVKGGRLPSQPEHFLASVADSTYDPTPDLAVFQGGSGTGQGYASTQYLPQDLYGYENVLDNTGTWSNNPTYGYVWFPRVSAGWRPYYQGRWSYLPRYGWTWVGQDKFAWPTHYYGRWGVTDRGAWYWIPSRQWGPAWVAWSVSPDYVGWCPLGWNGRPVYSFATVTGAGTSANNYRGSDTFRGWSVVGSRNFGYHDVPKYVVERSVIARDRPAFVNQYNAPRGPNGVVARTGRTYTAGSGTVTSGAVRRGNDPKPTQADESNYDRALRVMGRRTRPDGMSRDDNRDAGGNDGRSTVAPVLPKDENGTVRTPSGMSGPPGVYAPSRTAPRRTNDGNGNGNGNGGNGNNGSNNNGGNNNARGGTQSQPQAQPQQQSQPQQSTGGGGMRRSTPGNQSSSSSNSKESKSSKDDGSSGKSTDANSTSSSGSSGKSSDSNASGGAVRRRP
jgi:hypothetical protein